MNWIIYMLLANASLLIFYFVYKVLLEKETFFRLNRYFLLSAAGSAVLLPFLSPGSLPFGNWWLQLGNGFVSRTESKDLITQLSEVTISPGMESTPNWIIMAGIIYLIGLIIASTNFFVSIWKLRNAIVKPLSGMACSFFNYKYIDPQLPGTAVIDKHEEIHIRHLHSLDLLFFELLRIVFWFNPVLKAYQQSIMSVHEFHADEVAAAFQGDKASYAILLFSRALGTDPQILSNSFFNESLLKTRINMLNKSKSAKTAVLKYALFVPLCAGTLILTSATLTGRISEQSKKVSNAKAADEMPSFPGGMNKFYEYLSKSIKYPESAAKKKIEGKVFVSYVVEADGQLSNVKVVRGVDAALDAEAVRVVEGSPKWNPGKIDNKAVRTEFNIPINFALTKKAGKV